MTGTALERIEQDFEEFQRCVADCRAADPFRAEQFRNAYGALGRLRDRYLHEKEHLTATQRRAWQKVFEDDWFTEGMMEVRQMSEHVIRSAQLVTTSDVPIFVETSARAMFAAASVPLTDTQNGNTHLFDHLEQLAEMERRIKTALVNAAA